MKIIDTKIKDLKIIKSEIFSDKRGFLRETYRKNLLKKQDFPINSANRWSQVSPFKHPSESV